MGILKLEYKKISVTFLNNRLQSVSVLQSPNIRSAGNCYTQSLLQGSNYSIANITVSLFLDRGKTKIFF